MGNAESSSTGGGVTLNTDFSGPSGMGMLIRGSDGVMLWCLAERVESCVIKNNRRETIYSYPSWLDGGLPIDQGEALALLKGLEIARDRGYRNLVALTDHQPNVESINSTNNKKKSDIIQQIRGAKCNWFEQCEIKYVRREENRCANHLAHVAATQGPSSFEELKDSSVLRRLLQEDKDNLSNSFSTESGFDKALKVAAAAAAAAAVGYGTYKLTSHSKAEEPARQGKDKRVGWSSASRSIPEAGAANAGWEEEEEEEERMADPWTSSSSYIRERKGPSTGVYCRVEEENLQTGQISMTLESAAGAVAVWSRPDEGWVKLNTDFSGPSYLSGPSGMGFIIRDHRAELLWCFAKQVEDCNFTNAVGEALALLRGLQIARDRRYQKVVAETDHETNVKDINDVGYKGSHDARLEKAIMEVKRAFSWFEECEIRHIKREGNQCANHVARAAKSGSIPFEKLRDSDNLKKLLEEDEKKSFGTRSCKLGQSSTVSTMNGKLYL